MEEKLQSEIILDDYHKMCLNSAKKYPPAVKKNPQQKSGYNPQYITKGRQLRYYNGVNRKPEMSIKTLGENWNNYCINTGMINKLVVIDLDIQKDVWLEQGNNHPFIQSCLKHFDVKADEDWNDTLEGIIQGIETFTVRTQSGGFHLYFSIEEEMKSTVVDELSIDIRGFHSYIIGFGSTFKEGKKYEIEHDIPLQKATDYDFLFDLIYSVRKTDRKMNENRKKKREYVNTMKTMDFEYDICETDVRNIISKLPKSYIDNFSDWRIFTSFMKTLNMKPLWEEHSKSNKKHYTQDIDDFWDNLNTGDNFVKHIMKVVGKDKDLIYYKYKPILANLKQPDETTHCRKLEYTQGEKDYINTDRNLVIKSDTGTGKTTIMVKYISEIDAPFLSITSRTSLGEKQFDDFSVVERSKTKTYFYKDENLIGMPSFDILNGENMIIQLESLLKIYNWDFTEYVVFIDEFNSVISHFIGSTTMSHKKKQIWELLIRILTSAKQLICVDADISDLCFILLDGLNIDYVYRENIYQHNGGKEAEELYTFEQFVNEIKKNDKFLICCDSLDEANRLNKALNDNEIVVYDGNYKGKIDMSKPKIIITPKVIYGLDSNTEGGRAVFAYFKEHTINPTHMGQQISRERNWTKLYFYFPKKDEWKFNTAMFNGKDDVITHIEEFDKRFNQNYKEDLLNFNIRENDTQFELVSKMKEVAVDISEDYILHSALYKQMLVYYLYNEDAYATNKRLHFIRLLKQRGVLIINQEKREKSYSITEADAVKYDMMIYEEKKQAFDFTINTTYRRVHIFPKPTDYEKFKCGVYFENEIHQEIYKLLQLPVELFGGQPYFIHSLLSDDEGEVEQEPQDTNTIKADIIEGRLLNLFLYPKLLSQHFDICNLFIKDYYTLKYEVQRQSFSEFHSQLLFTSKCKILFLRELMMKTECVNGTLNASKMLNDAENKQVFYEYKTTFKQKTSQTEFADLQDISKKLIMMLKQILGSDTTKKLVIKPAKQRSPKNADGIRQYKPQKYVINKDLLEFHQNLYNYRNKPKEE